MRLNRDWYPFIGSLLIIGALYNHYLGHSVLLFEIILIIAGAIVMLAPFIFKEYREGIKTKERGLLISFFSRFLTENQCSVILPFTGFGIILLWSIWKIFISGSTDLRMEDFIVTIFGLSLVIYHSGPTKFQREKDFAVLYLLFLTIIFVVIWKSYFIITGDSNYRITVYSEYYLITVPVVSLLQLVGIDVNAVLNFSGIGLANIIEYQYEGHLLRVGIGSGCSGLYSAGLFFSAFLAFVLVRYRKIDRYILAALLLGLLVTWVSNIIRMAVTIVVGVKYGAPALATFHMYFGILLFVVLITIFWMLIIRWLDRVEAKKDQEMKGIEQSVVETSAIPASKNQLAEESGPGEETQNSILKMD